MLARVGRGSWRVHRSEKFGCATVRNKRFRKIETHATVEFTMTAVARHYASESLRRCLESEKQQY
jgi:hypothetical protein